jgi:CRISPR-associated protein Csm2
MMVINGKDYVDKAETAIKELIAELKAANKANNRKDSILTTSQIRKQLAMTAELFTQAEAETGEILSDDLQNKIEYLRVQFIYQAGREASVKKFIEKAGIMDILKNIKGKREDFLTFCRYMEALVAYRKYLGETDK